MLKVPTLHESGDEYHLMTRRAVRTDYPQASLPGLPPEVRLRIYDHLWMNLRPVTIYIVGGECDIVTREDAEDKDDRIARFRGRRKSVSSKTIALLWTCKLLFREARPALFEKLPFVIDLLGSTVESAGSKSILDDGTFGYLLQHMRNVSVEASMFVYGGRERPCVPRFWHEYMLRDIKTLNASIRPDCVQRSLTVFLGHVKALTARNCMAFARIRWGGSVVVKMHASTYESIAADAELAGMLMVAMSATSW